MVDNYYNHKQQLQNNIFYGSLTFYMSLRIGPPKF